MPGISRVLSSSFGKEVCLTWPNVCRNSCTIFLYESLEELHRSDITTNGFKNRVENISNSDEELNDKRLKIFKYLGDTQLITSSKFLDCTDDEVVQEIHQTLEEANLTSPQAFECPASYVDYKNHELHEIFKLMKDVCNTHKLPLAQTWTVSSRNIEMTCNSFNTICLGKVCMSTTGLPFYVHDLRFWHFREACKKHHLLKSKGVVGRVLSSHGSCFCADVTKLQETEYSLVHNARMSGLTSCFAVYLHSNEHNEGYILEFFLPVDMKEDAELQNLVRMMKMHFKFSSLEFGDLSRMEVIGMRREATQLLSAVQLDPHEVGESNAQIDYINSQDQCDFGQVSHMNRRTIITNSEEQYDGDVIMNTEGMFEDDATSKKIDVATCTTLRRKRKIDSITPESIQQYFGKPAAEASRKLDVSRSTTKCVCQELSIASWPMPRHSNKYSQKHNAFVCKSNASANISPKHETIYGSLYNPEVSTESDETSSKPSQAHSGVYQTSPKKEKMAVKDSDTKTVTVKVTYKDDMIKFQFPVSSGVLELKNQVARRFKLKSTRLRLKYMDEDNDLILISCDADFHNLMPFSASSVGKNTIKLVVEMADN